MAARLMERRLTLEQTLGAFVCVKMIADVFWQISFLDYLLLAAAIVLFLLSVTRSDVSYGLTDAAFFVLLGLLTASLIRNLEGATTFAKMASSILLYLIGRTNARAFDAVVHGLLVSSYVIVGLNLLSFLNGSGFQLWGNAQTFSGLYFFKTDLACAMCTVLIIQLFCGHKGPARLIALGLSVLFIIMSDTRMYWIITAAVLLVYVAYRRSVGINVRLIAGIALAGIALLYFLNWLFSMGAFSSFGFIGFQFDNLSDLLDASNTQGRNVIWESLIAEIAESGPAGWLFGIDLAGDSVLVNGSMYGSHSLYVGLLFNCGALGLATFAVAMAGVFRSVALLAHGNRKAAFVAFCLLLQLLLGGISVHVLQYTGNSWMPMLFMGMIVSLSTGWPGLRTNENGRVDAWQE